MIYYNQMKRDTLYREIPGGGKQGDSEMKLTTNLEKNLISRIFNDYMNRLGNGGGYKVLGQIKVSEGEPYKYGFVGEAELVGWENDQDKIFVSDFGVIEYDVVIRRNPESDDDEEVAEAAEPGFYNKTATVRYEFTANGDFKTVWSDNVMKSDWEERISFKK